MHANHFPHFEIAWQGTDAAYLHGCGYVEWFSIEAGPQGSCRSCEHTDRDWRSMYIVVDSIEKLDRTDPFDGHDIDAGGSCRKPGCAWFSDHEDERVHTTENGDPL